LKNNKLSINLFQRSEKLSSFNHGSSNLFLSMAKKAFAHDSASLLCLVNLLIQVWEELFSLNLSRLLALNPGLV